MKKLYNYLSESELKKVRLAQQCRLNLVRPKSFVGYPFIIAIMAVLQVMTVMYDDKYFMFLGLNVSAGWFILMPVMLYLFQIVAECYGWQYARQIVWCNFVVNVLAFLIMLFFKYIPLTAINSTTLTKVYAVILDDKIIHAFMMIFAMLSADLVTSALMAWSKFHWNGRHVMIRVLFLHLISEIIILSTGFVTCPLTGYTWHETWILTRDSFYARTVIMFALLPAVRYVIYWLQNRVEGVIVFDYKRDVRIFVIKINNDDIAQFHAKEWNELPVGTKKEFNIERAVLLYNSTHGSGMRIY